MASRYAFTGYTPSTHPGKLGHQHKVCLIFKRIDKMNDIFVLQCFENLQHKTVRAFNAYRYAHVTKVQSSNHGQIYVRQYVSYANLDLAPEVPKFLFFFP